MGAKLKPRRLTDASVAKLALAKSAAGYFCRDDILPGFSIRVGLNRRTWRYDHEYRDESGRRHQISVKLGEFKPSEPGHVGADEARAKVPNTPEQRRALANRDDDARMTMATAFGKYKELMVKKGRSQRTIEDYTFKFGSLRPTRSVKNCSSPASNAASACPLPPDPDKPSHGCVLQA
jgi:hypothetical protein